jgi:hypothetical protein
MARKEATEHREVKRELEGLLCMHRCEWDLTESKSLPMFLSGRYGAMMYAAAKLQSVSKATNGATTTHPAHPKCPCPNKKQKLIKMVD